MIFLNIGKSFSRNRQKLSLGWYFASGGILVLLAGLRFRYVGTDTNNYIYAFEKLQYSGANFLTNTTSHEAGYILLQNITMLFSREYWALLTAIALVGVSFYFYTIKRLSPNIIVSVFLYITLASYLFAFNGARQGLAASVFGVALIYLIEKKLVKFVIWVLIASLFHRTVLVMLPFYFLLRFRFSVKNTLIFSTVSFLSVSYLSFFLTFLEGDIANRYAAYEGRGALGGENLALYFISLSFLFVLWRKEIPASIMERYDLYLNICIFSSIIYLVVITTGIDVNFIRFTLYFSMGYILIWPIILSNVKLFKIGASRFLFFFVHLLFYYIYLGKMSSLTPYQFNPSLF